MAEKLIPFDFEEFKKDPMRLRHANGVSPTRAGVALDDSVGVVWECGSYGHVCLPREFSNLRLAAKARKVRVRLFKNIHGEVVARTSDGVDLDQADYCGNSWVSDISEVEITE